MRPPEQPATLTAQQVHTSEEWHYVASALFRVAYHAPAMLLGTQALGWTPGGLVRFCIREAFWRRFRPA